MARGRSIVNINGESRAERKELVDCRCTSVGQNEVVLDDEEVTIKKNSILGKRDKVVWLCSCVERLRAKVRS